MEFHTAKIVKKKSRQAFKHLNFNEPIICLSHRIINAMQLNGIRNIVLESVAIYFILNIVFVVAATAFCTIKYF